MSTRHTPGPLTTDAVLHKLALDICLDYKVEGEGSPILLGFAYDDEDGGPLFKRAERNARLLAAGYTSYDKHCGDRAVECAEADLLGELIAAGQELLNLIDDVPIDMALGDETDRVFPRYEFERIRAVLAKAKGAN